MNDKSLPLLSALQFVQPFDQNTQYSRTVLTLTYCFKQSTKIVDQNRRSIDTPLRAVEKYPNHILTHAIQSKFCGYQT